MLLVRVVTSIVVGLILGYLIATLLENALHRYIKHCGPYGRSIWKRYPLLSFLFMRAYYSHSIVHHRLTYTHDFVTQFNSKEHKQSVDGKLYGHFGELVRREAYGLSLIGSGLFAFNVPVIPFIPIIGSFLGPWVLLGALPGLIAYSLITKYVHPYLHQRYEIAMAEAPPIIRRILATRYMKISAQNHYMHHEYLHCNYNLLLGADYLLGHYRPPSTRDYENMRRIGVVTFANRGDR